MNKRPATTEADIKNKTIWLLVYFLLSVAGNVLGILCLYKSDIAVIEKHILLFSVLVGVFFIVSFVCSVFVTLSSKEIWKKTLLSVYILIVFALTVLFILQITGFFVLIKDEASLQAYLQGAGRWMPFVYVALQYLQVVLLPIPGIVSTLAGVALFGAIPTIIYSIIGIVAGSLTAFFIGRKLGHKAVAWLIGVEELDKWQAKLKGKDLLFLTLAFLLPVFPDDILCFVAGLSSMSWQYFAVMILVSRIVSVSATCFSFDFIPFNTWWGLLIWGAIILAIIFVFVLLYKNFDKLQEKLAKRFRIFQKNKNNHSKNK